jgi:UDP-N-acetylglucosamine pyrophosphorylase
MKSDLPKVLHIFNGKPLVAHVIENLGGTGIKDIIVVVGYRGEMVVDVLASSVRTVWQREQLGTGHAALQAIGSLTSETEQVIIACGDVPLIRSETFFRLIRSLKEEGVRAAVLTMELDKPSGYGRIKKDAEGFFDRIVEEKDADEEEKKIKEVNTGTYIFDKEMLINGLSRLTTDNAQQEYYLTDVLYHIRSNGYKIKTILLDDPIEGSGINSKEELQKLESYCSGLS